MELESTASDVNAIAELTPDPVIVAQQTDAPVVFVKKGYEPHDLSKYLDTPMRIEETIAMLDEDSFTEYYERFKTDASALLISSPEHHRFTGVMDYHTPAKPGNLKHSVTYECPESPEWKTWIRSDGIQVGQQQFALFLESNLPDIVEPAGAKLLEIAKTMQAKRKVEWKQGTRLDNGDVQFTYVEDTKGTATKGNIEIPDEFILGIPVFLNGNPYKVKAKLRWRIDGDSKHLKIWYDLERPHKVLEHAFSEAVTRIREAITENVYLSNL